MPIPAHRRLTFEGIFGTLAVPVEEWSFRLNLAPGETPGGEAGFLTAAHAAYTTHMATRINSNARLRLVKLANIGADGLYVDEPVLLETDTPGAVTASANFPLQVSVAVSLVTSRRGPTGKGRFFLPSPVMSTLSTSGVMTTTAANSITTAAAGFLSAINGPAGFGNVVVASSKGYLTPVTGVRVGLVPDTIRSRRAKLAESYVPTQAVAS